MQIQLSVFQLQGLLPTDQDRERERCWCFPTEELAAGFI